MTELFAGGASRAIGLALVQFVWQGAVIAALVAGTLTLLRKASPNARYLVGCAGLAAMIAAPVLTLIASATRSPDGARPGTVAVTSSEASVQLLPATVVMPPRAVASPDGYLGITPEQLDAWLPLIAGAWTLGVLFLTVRLLSGWLTVRTIKNRVMLAVPLGWTEKTATIAHALGIARRVTIGISSSVDVPTVIGWMRPLILVPASTIAGLPPFQFEAILAHELAHIRRHDYLVNVLQNAAETLLFYHPAVWWLSNRVREEREHCCDDVAVEYCGDRVAYAGALASLESLRLRAPILAVAANSGDLLTRIRRVLGVPSQSVMSPAWVLALVALLPVAVPIVGAQAHLPVASVPALSMVPAAPVAVSPLATEGTESGSRGVQQPTTAPSPQSSRPTDAPTPSVDKLRDAGVPTGDTLELVRQQSQTLREIAVKTGEFGVYFDRPGFPGVPAAPQAPPTLGSLEELLRSARVSKDMTAILRLLDPDFTSTDPSGATWNRLQSQEELRTSPIMAITIESVSGTVLETTAFTTGVQTQVTSAGRERVHFTRVWKAGSPTWRLLRSVEFKVPAAATPVAPPGTVVRVGGNVKEPQLLTPNISPIYPQVAKNARIQGLVIVEVIIDEEGRVTNERVIKPVHGLLDQAALATVRQWRYTPTLLNGVPVSVLLNVSVNFALQ